MAQGSIMMLFLIIVIVIVVVIVTIGQTLVQYYLVNHLKISKNNYKTLCGSA